MSPVNPRYKQVRLASQGVPYQVGRNLTGIGFAGDAFVYVMN